MKIFELVSDEVLVERDWHSVVSRSEDEKEEERIEKDSRIVEVLHGFYSF